MPNTNLVLPLLALGMYSHCHNINLANNTSLLIIVLALALQQREISKIEDNMNNDNNTNVYRRTTNTTVNNGNSTTTFTTSSNCPFCQQGNFTTLPFPANFNNGTWFNNGCNCQNNGCQAFTASCPRHAFVY